jgi:hypothetical protein
MGGPGGVRKACFGHTGENTGDPWQQSGVIGSSGKRCDTLINTGSVAIQSQPQSMAEIGFPATLNRQVVGSIPTASTMIIKGLSLTAGFLSRCNPGVPIGKLTETYMRGQLRIRAKSRNFGEVP